MRVLAFDPGATTGYAVLARSKKGIVLEAAGTFKYDEGKNATGLGIYEIIRDARPQLVAVENWEDRPGEVTRHSIWPNRIIGHVEAYTALLGIHLALVSGAVWKGSFVAHARSKALQLPVELEPKHEKIASQITYLLRHWPKTLNTVPPEALRHAVDATGLACWILRSRRYAC